MQGSNHIQRLTRAGGWLLALLALWGVLLWSSAAHAAQQRTEFDHLTTGFELLGEHRDLPCESCHVNAVFKGTPRTCDGCHGIGTLVRATAKSKDHIQSTNRCEVCHTPNAWKPAVNFDHAQTMGSCSTCHNGVQAPGKPANHPPTTQQCDVCHSTVGWGAATFSHAGITSGCAKCHDGKTATGLAANHIPTANLDCNAAGCHSTVNVNPGGFFLGSANISTPTLTTVGHTSVASVVAGCQSCHETAPYLGMVASSATAAGDSRPSATLDKNHPTTGDCNGCHTTTPTFAADSTGGGKPPNHIPTNAPCAQCHTTAGNYAVYSVIGTHQGVTNCLSCHAPAVANTFANITITTNPSNHIPVGTLDCNGSGCHTANNVGSGGFHIGAANINTPTLTTSGHATVASAVASCQSCHESAQYLGMVASTSSTAGDSRPNATLDKAHPTSGDCGGCHTTTPTFATDASAGAKPANHIPTNAPCAQCHTTAGNYAVYSVTGTHQGVTNCLSCHAPAVANTFANVTITSTPGNHIPIGSLDCNGSGCHTTSNVNAGGFHLGSANINTPTLTAAGHTTVASAVASCQSCHESAPYLGMVASTSSTAGDSRPNATLDKSHPTSGDCSGCHTTTPTFASDANGGNKPANHIPTNAPCAQCHTTAGNYAAYSVTGTHQGVTNCLSCHAPAVANTFANVTITSTPGNHIPIGSLDCNGSGCHTTSNVNAGGFHLGSANINTPTLTTAGHTTVASAVASCQSCHESAPYLGMVASTSSTAGDSRPNATLDNAHPTSGDCSGCHTTTPTFASDANGGNKPANHIPTNAPCAQCHTTAGNYAAYSVTGTHQGVTNCLSCHAPAVANTFANVTITSTPGNHIPIGSLDCNGSGCHTTSNVNAGGFHLGSANINTPTLTTAGHTTVASAVASCQSCHESAPYLGMMASTSTTAGDSRPNATLDKSHPTSGDCSGCHTTTPTFSSDVSGGAKPANHIPTNAPCAQCHTTAGNYAVYSVTGTHQGVSNCLSCHAPAVANTFANITITSTPGNHIPIGSLDCNGSGCHSTSNVNSGGFHLGSANINSPTLTTTGHTTVASAVASCQSCHESAPYLGMVASTSTAAGDSRPNATLDKNHPTSGDCSGCHSTTPTFTSNASGATKPANHIPTTAACAQCHTTAGNYAVYSVTGTHQGVTSCLTCHAPAVANTFANVTITTTPGNHIPIGSLDCKGSGCHSTSNVNPGGFHLGSASITNPTLTTAGHTTVLAAVGSCQTCHQSAPYLGMVASTSSAAGDSRPNATLDKNHPGSGDCSGCHTTTPTFASNASGVTKPANHIPTSQPCSLCHTTPGNYSVYVMGATGHTGITSGCATCHGPTVANTFANISIKTTPGNHVPYGSAACESCHSNSNFISFGPGTQVNHTAVAVLACDGCHEYNMANMWYGVTNITVRPGQPPNGHHYPTDCKGCHSPKGGFAVQPGGPTTKSIVQGKNAATAQTPATASGPGRASTFGLAAAAPHPNPLSTPAGLAAAAAAFASPGRATLASPGSVTTAPSSVPRAVDHSRLMTSCVTCHNGVTAAGKPRMHVASNSQCENCHTTNGWIPARFEHSALMPHTCTTCHDSVHAIGKPRGHVATAQQCDSCHGTLAWLPVVFDHAAISGACASCHNNAGAMGKSVNHMVTQRDCASCHTPVAWSVVVAYRHVSAAYPGPHWAALSCASCHKSGTEQVTYVAPANAGACGGCHARDFKPAAHPRTSKGLFYTASELSNCSGACHIYSDSTQSAVVHSQPGPRHRVSDATFRH